MSLRRAGRNLVLAVVTGVAALVMGCASTPVSATAPAPEVVPSAREFGVLLMAHGGPPEWNEAVLETVKPLKSKYDIEVAFGVVRARAPFRRVHVETLREDWPEKRVDAEKRIRDFVQRASSEGGKAIVIPFRVQGFGPYAKVLEGLDYAADGIGLIPHAEVTKWIERQISAVGAGPFRPSSAHVAAR